MVMEMKRGYAYRLRKSFIQLSREEIDLGFLERGLNWMLDIG